MGGRGSRGTGGGGEGEWRRREEKMGFSSETCLNTERLPDGRVTLEQQRKGREWVGGWGETAKANMCSFMCIR